MPLLRRRFKLPLLLHKRTIDDGVRLVQAGRVCKITLPASSVASASTEALTKVDPSGNTLTIVVGRG